MVLVMTDNAATANGTEPRAFGTLNFEPDKFEQVQRLEIMVNMTDRRLAFRLSKHAVWKDASVRLPASVRPWAILGCEDVQITLTLAAGEMPVPHGVQTQAALAEDVILTVGDIQVPAHGAILTAHSKVFASILEAQSSAPKQIVLDDLEASLLQQLLRFLYTGEVEPGVLAEDASAMALLQVAHRYEIQVLEDICSQALVGRLQILTAAEILITANSMNYSSLKKGCLSFIASHMEEVRETDSYKILSESNPPLMFEIIETLTPMLKKQRTM